jgi:hypothetical protein
MYVRGQASALQHIPITEPVRQFSETQKDWTGGRGRKFAREDPTAFWDAKDTWTMTGGKVFPNPQWYFGSGIRTAIGTYEGSVTWRGCYGSERYISDTFVPTASTAMTARQIMVKIKQVGLPGTLRVGIYSHNAGTSSPDSLLASNTVTATAGKFESQDLEFAFSQALGAATRYWVVAYGAAADNSSNHWEIATNAAGTGGKVSSDGTTWAAGSPTYSLYYRITPVEVQQKLYYFIFEKALYAISAKDANSAPELYINGDTGIATSATSSTLTDTAGGVGSAWTASAWAGYKVRIIAGAGVGQVRTISDNTTDTLTVTPNWRKTPTTTSRYIIFGGPKFTEITGHGLTVAPTSRPCSANAIAYFCQGTAVNVRRMQINTGNANNHEFKDTDTPYRYDFFEVHNMPNLGLRLFAAKSLTCAAGYAALPSWADTPVAFTGIKGNVIGNTESRVTAVRSLGETIYFGKEDGLWYLDESTPKQFTLSVKDVPSFNNLSAMSAQGDTVYFGYGDSFGYLSGTTHKDLLNYRAGYEGLPSDRAGTVSAVTTSLGWVFFAVDGGDDNYSSVYAWNGIGIHEVWRSWKTGCRVRDLFFYPAYESRGQLWIDANGEPAYIEFPLKRTNPLLDTSLSHRCEFSYTTGTMDIEKENLYKAFKYIRVTSENLSAGSRWIEVDYQADEDVETSNWTYIGSITQSPLQEIAFQKGSVKKIRFRFRGYTNDTSTPVVMTSHDILGEVFEPPRYQWVGTFQVAEEQETYDGQADFKPTEVWKWLKECHDKGIVCTMSAARSIDHDKKVTVSLPADVCDIIEKGKWDGRISIQFRE